MSALSRWAEEVQGKTADQAYAYYKQQDAKDIRLQIAFQELERNMPIFGICIEKRLAGIVNRRWRIAPTSDMGSISGR